MSQLQSKILTDTWVKATWDDYLDAAKTLETAKGYYYNGHYRLEMTPIGFDHGCDHTIIMLAIHLYSLARKIDFQGINTCSYRKIGYREVQPDASYYIGATANIIPSGTSIVDLDRYPAPDLVIEVSKSTLGDDLGNKRLLYEELGVSEYWVVDVQNAQVIAFKIIYQGSQRIHTSQILPGLEINLLNEALQRSRQSNHSQVGQWLLQVFQFEN
jgi:Uma2 family endonuclease